MITKYKKLSFSGIVFGGILIALIGFIGLTNGIAKADYFNKTDIKAAEDISEKSTKSITITLSDNMEEFDNNSPTSTYLNTPPPYIVTPEDVNNMTNELKKLGAANINVNGEQITEKSEIEANGPFISVNGKKCISPFTIKAEWKENISENSLLNNSVINDLKSRKKIIIDINNNNTYIYNVVKEAFLTKEGYTGELTKHMSREVFEKINIFNSYPVNSEELRLSYAADFKLKQVSQQRIDDLVYVKMIYSMKIIDSHNKPIGGSSNVPITFTVKNTEGNWYIINKEEPA